MYGILYLPTGEFIKHRQYDDVLIIESYRDAFLWVELYRNALKTDTVSIISCKHFLEIVEVDNV